MLMNFILKISAFVFGAGLWAFIIKWVVEEARNFRIKKKLFRNVLYELFFNTMVMGFTCETNQELLNNLGEIIIPKHKYFFTAWQVLMQTGFIKNIKFEDLILLEQIYFRIENLDQAIRPYYDLSYDKRLANKKAFQYNTDKLLELYNGLVSSNKFSKWSRKYRESFVKDNLKLMSEFEGQEFSSSLLYKGEEKSK